MLQNKNKFHLVYWVYLFFGLLFLFIITKSWLPKEFTLAGHDSGLPLSSKEFLATRLFAWDDRINFGRDNSHLFGSLTLHLVDYLSSIIAGVPHAGNWANLFIWLSLMFLASFIFAYQLKNTLSKYFPLLFPPLVIFNFYIFQSIFMLERAKYGILVATFLFLSIVFKFQERKLNIFWASALASLVFTLFNGGGLIGLPLYGSLIVILLSLIIFYFIESLIKKDFSIILRLVLFFLLTGLGLVFLNAYQILPFLPGLFDKMYLAHLGNRAIQSSKAWVDYISQSVSFINLFRLQGLPAWYSGSNIVDVAHTYASLYTGDSLMVIISFLFPVLTFLSLIFAKPGKQKRIVLFFALTVAISMFFVAGTHPPLGFLFRLFFENIPGFSIFRTPYYKFAGAFFISICVLIAFSASIFIERFSSKITKRFQGKEALNIIVCFLLIVLWFSYHHVLFNPENVFSWKKGSSTKLEIPDYVSRFTSWTQAQSKIKQRVLLIPPSGEESLSDAYEWGYWSLSPLPYVLLDLTTLTDEANLTHQELVWIKSLYKSIQEGNEEEMINLATRLGVKYILSRSDSLNADSTQDYKQILNSFSGLQKIESFGKWEFYEIKSQESKISAISFLTLASDSSSIIRTLAGKNRLLYNNSNMPEGLFEQFYDRKINSYYCQSCLIEQRKINERLPSVTILPNSPLYLFKSFNEKRTLKNIETPADKVHAYLTFVLRRVSEIRSMSVLEIEDKDIVSSLKTSKAYLDEAIGLLEENRGQLTDYDQARRIFEIIEPIQNNLRDYVGKYEFLTKSGEIRKYVFLVLWDLSRIFQLYEPLVGSPENLRSNKVYYLDSLENREHDLYIDPTQMPADGQGGTLMPRSIVYDVGGEEKELGLDTFEGVFKISGIFQKPGNTILTMQFNLPNLFVDKGTAIKEFPSGPANCYVGKIADFNPTRTYEVNIASKNRIQIVRLIFEDDKQASLYDSGFLQGHEEMQFNPTGVNMPFRYTYKPNAFYKNPTIYLCSRDLDLPEIDSVVVYELFSPTFISVEEGKRGQPSAPVINYEKISPVKYKVSMKNTSEPFILLFNERYNFLWKLYKTDEKRSLVNLIRNQDNHFIVDGYANAWVVREKGNSEWVLEYVPQNLFYIGAVVSAISLVSVFLIIYFKNKKRYI